MLSCFNNLTAAQTGLPAPDKTWQFEQIKRRQLQLDRLRGRYNLLISLAEVTISLSL